MPNLIQYKNKWIGSYETLKFDTLDGDLDFGQYAKTEGGYLIRTKPKTEAQFEGVDFSYDVSKLKEVKILSGHCYYDEFRSATGNTVRIQSNAKKYWDTAKIKNYPQPIRTEMVEKIPVFQEDTLPEPPEHHSIALDVASNSGLKSAISSYSWSHECTGENRLLVFGHSHLATTTRTISAVTFNGDALSYIRNDLRTQVPKYWRTYLYYMVAPDTGAAYTLAVTLSGAVTEAVGGAISFTGAAQTGQPDKNGGANGTGTIASVSITTIADNSWVVDVFFHGSFNITCNNTQRWKVDTNPTHGGADTNGPKTPAGAQTMSWTASLSNQWAISAASFAPAVAAGTNMNTNIGDTFKDVDSLKINISGVWKDVIAVKQNIGDVWKNVFG